MVASATAMRLEQNSSLADQPASWTSGDKRRRGAVMFLIGQRDLLMPYLLRGKK